MNQKFLFVIQYQLGKTLMVLTFALDVWVETGGDVDFTAEDAKEEAKRHAENAVQIFKEVIEKIIIINIFYFHVCSCVLLSHRKDAFCLVVHTCISPFSCTIFTAVSRGKLLTGEHLSLEA